MGREGGERKGETVNILGSVFHNKGKGIEKKGDSVASSSKGNIKLILPVI